MIDINCESSYHYLGDKIDLYLLFIFQLFGEKSEEAEELRLDLQDVKEMYKMQIEDLLRKQNSSN